MNVFFLFAAMALLLWSAAFLYLRAFVRRGTRPDHILHLLREEITRLEADIDEKTEENLQLIEEKIGQLREICNEAEKRIAVYTRELENRSGEARAYAALGRTAPEPAKRVRRAGGTNAKNAKSRARDNTPLIKRLEVMTPAETASAAYRAEHAAAGREEPAPRQAADQAHGTAARQPEEPQTPRITVAAEQINPKPPPLRERVG
ncbi:MAG: hypothetical protein LBN92_01465 [Treponema sp.]|jgi:hypothetical protein|nr:hypothetical protein [Treponema sp.]